MESKTPKKHAGALRSRGRPALQEGLTTVPVNIRMTAPQRAKLGRLGGAQWVRDRIDKARDPGPDD